MTLAARCPSCDTVFRVVRDQLRVSEGWVRCGRCDGVFNAVDVLFDIDTGQAVHLSLDEALDSGAADLVADTARRARDFDSPAEPWPEPASAPAPLPAQNPGHPSAQPGADTSARPAFPPSAQAPTAPPADWGPSQAHWTPSVDDPSSAVHDRSPAALDRLEPRFDSASMPWPDADANQRHEPLLHTPSSMADLEPLGLDELVHLAPSRGADLAAAPPELVAAATVASAAATAATEPAEPSFMRAAERRAKLERPAMRAALSAGVLLLAGLVMAQLALVWRDTLAAHVPAAAPALQALCRLAACTVQPLRRIELLSVDSSGLNRLDGSPLYQLQLVMHNRADTALLMPALDLVLNDGQGKPLSRRVLTAADLGLTQTVLQAGQELPITVLMSTGEQQVDGYTVELFYP